MTELIRRLDARTAGFEEALAELRRKLSPSGDVVSAAGRAKTIEVFGEPLAPRDVVERICRDVASRGLERLLYYARAFDDPSMSSDTLRVPSNALAEADAGCPSELKATFEAVGARIRRFQEALLPSDVRLEPAPGVELEHRYRPIRRVGICVPGGAAAYPSTLLMTAVPAQVAGVSEIAVMAPPTPHGADHPAIRALCHALGIRELYRMGGAQGVAALAYGVDGIPPVDLIVGPGNLFVALAKAHVYGQVGIDAIAGPSEIVVVADRTACADWIAADMLAQAEHAPGASYLVTWVPSLADDVAQALARRLATLDRHDVTRQSLEQFGRLILVRDRAHALDVTNRIAPEHLEVMLDDPDAWVDGVETAGAVFVGAHSPVALGDYVAGPSHVLPTGGTGRFASGLSAQSFLRSHSVIRYTKRALRPEAEHVVRLAELEGLTAHRDSIRVRTVECKREPSAR